MFAKTSLFQKSKQIQKIKQKRERERSDRKKIAIEEGKGDGLPGPKPNPKEVNHGNKKNGHQRTNQSKSVFNEI